jgi:DNA-binding response OmpR family regulator
MATKKSVLVVTSSPSTAGDLRNYIKSLGHTVEWSLDAVNAEKSIAEFYDLIVWDQLNGDEVRLIVTAARKFPNTVMITMAESSITRTNHFEMGCKVEADKATIKMVLKELLANESPVPQPTVA